MLCNEVCYMKIYNFTRSHLCMHDFHVYYVLATIPSSNKVIHRPREDNKVYATMYDSVPCHNPAFVYR